jgi:hypothetical protein
LTEEYREGVLHERERVRSIVQRMRDDHEKFEPTSITQAAMKGLLLGELDAILTVVLEPERNDK